MSLLKSLLQKGEGSSSLPPFFLECLGPSGMAPSLQAYSWSGSVTCSLRGVGMSACLGLSPLRGWIS
jgi:hypothetical protein